MKIVVTNRNNRTSVFPHGWSESLLKHRRPLWTLRVEVKQWNDLFFLNKIFRRFIAFILLFFKPVAKKHQSHLLVLDVLLLVTCSKGLQICELQKNISHWYFTLLYRFLWTFWNDICVYRIMPKPAPSDHYSHCCSFGFLPGHASRVNVSFDLHNIIYDDHYRPVCIFKDIRPSELHRSFFFSLQTLAVESGASKPAMWIYDSFYFTRYLQH